MVIIWKNKTLIISSLHTNSNMYAQRIWTHAPTGHKQTWVKEKESRAISAIFAHTPGRQANTGSREREQMRESSIFVYASGITAPKNPAPGSEVKNIFGYNLCYLLTPN
jgi:hypothetical protein